jgi:membrane protease YdiL (CAAX protease family)
MTSGEIIFISVTSGLLVVSFLISLVLKNKIPWIELGLTPKLWWRGWFPILVFSIAVFFLIQLLTPSLEIPAWVTDKDPIVILLVIVFLQEFIFRAVLLTWLERFGKQKALLIGAVLFAAIHIFLPHPWLITGISLIGGYFWGWHFLKYRNIYWLVVSHLIVNLSFNYLFFT